MKVLLTGATGTIGRAALDQCLAHPKVSSVVVFVRRPLPDDVASHEKLDTVILRDFSEWPSDLISRYADANAMIWAMGSWDGNPVVEIDYPLAFQKAFIGHHDARPQDDGQEFRYIHLSGKTSVQNQETWLLYLDRPRKNKGLHETRALELAKNHSSWWKLFIVRPGGVLTRNMMGSTAASAIMGKDWSIKAEELGAYMAHLAVDGTEAEGLIENRRMVDKGRGLLRK